jgi:hypothetical protein
MNLDCATNCDGKDYLRIHRLREERFRQLISQRILETRRNYSHAGFPAIRSSRIHTQLERFSSAPALWSKKYFQSFAQHFPDETATGARQGISKSDSDWWTGVFCHEAICEWAQSFDVIRASGILRNSTSFSIGVTPQRGDSAGSGRRAVCGSELGPSRASATRHRPPAAHFRFPGAALRRCRGAIIPSTRTAHASRRRIRSGPGTRDCATGRRVPRGHSDLEPAARRIELSRPRPRRSHRIPSLRTS